MKRYLEQALEPISDADASVLSDYAMALLRHDSSEEEVRQLCYSQLEDFLRQETIPFVDKIFDVLREKSYLEGASNMPSTGMVTEEVSRYSPTSSMIPATNSMETNFNNSLPAVGKTNTFPSQVPNMFGPPLYHPAATAPSEFMPSIPGFGNLPNPAMPPIPFLPFNPAAQPPFPPPFKMRGKRGFGMRHEHNSELRRHSPGNRRFNPYKAYPQPHLGHRFSRNAGNDPTSTALEVRNIPEEHFNEENIRSFFSKFGVLEKVELNPTHHSCVLEFTSHEAANNAWSSPEPIFNNRFIKIFWYNPSKGFHNRPKKFASHKSPTTSDSSNVESSEDVDPASLLQNEEFHKLIEERQRQHEERLKRINANKKALEELNQKKRELAQQQLKEQELLMQKIKETDRSGNKRLMLLETQHSLLKAEADCLGLPVSNVSESPAASNGSHHPYASGLPQRGTNTFFRGRGRGRGDMFASMSIDNRPTKLRVINVSPEKNEALLQYLFTVGGYEEITEPSTTERLISFQNRNSAEKFFGGVRNVEKLQELELAWVPKTAVTTNTTSMETGESNTSDNMNIEVEEGRWR